MFCVSKILHLFSCSHSQKRTNRLHSQDDPLTRSEEFLIAPPTQPFHRKPLPTKLIRLETIPEADHIVYASISAQSNDVVSAGDEGEGQPIASFTTGWYEVLNDADSEQWVFQYLNDTPFGVTWPLRRVRKTRAEKGEGIQEERENGEGESVAEENGDKLSAVFEVYEERQEGRECCRTLFSGYEADDELTIGTLCTKLTAPKALRRHSSVLTLTPHSQIGTRRGTRFAKQTLQTVN
jgi:hypothetical protein